MSTHDLVIQSVSKRFGATVALDDVSLAIDHGEFVTLLGPSGCGKTTLLRLVAGFDVPDSGTIHLGRDDVTNRPAHRRDVHTVFQNYALFPHLSVARNVSFGLEQRRLDKHLVASKVDEMLQLVQLRDLRDRLPSQLSGGQQQRVALARALVLEPRVLLLDEPLAALDRKLREAMQFELKQIQRTLGITFLFVTHDQDEALAMSDRVVVMNEGRVEQIGTPREIYERPSTKFTADFVGVSNLLAGRVKSSNGGGSVVETESGRFTVTETLSVGEDILLSVRPECVRLEDSELAESLAGIVESIRYLGDSTQVRVRLADGSTWVVADRFGTGRAAPDPGSHVYLSWNAADAVRLEQ